MTSSISCFSALILLREASGDKNFRYMDHRGSPDERGVVPVVLSCAKRLLLVGGTSSAGPWQQGATVGAVWRPYLQRGQPLYAGKQLAPEIFRYMKSLAVPSSTGLC